MPAVSAHAGPEARALGHRNPGVGTFADVEAPGVVEVVLGARTFERRLRLAVDVEEVVALAEPARLSLDHREHGAHVVAAALHVQHLVRPSPRVRQGLPIAGVEVGRVGRQRRQLLPVHLVVEVMDAATPLVRDRDAARLAEGHGPVAVPRTTVGAVADHEGLNRSLEAMAHGEEVAQGCVHAGGGAPVVVDAQAQQPRPPELAVGHGDPDVGDSTRAFEVGQHRRLAGDRPLAVVVRVGVGVVRGRAPSREVLGLHQPEGIGQGHRRFFGLSPAREQQQGQDEARARDHLASSVGTKAAWISARPTPRTLRATVSRVAPSPTKCRVRCLCTSEAAGARAAAGDEVSSS